MAFKTGGRKCKFESLETRQMMAGDVFASVHAGKLFIKGDNLSNGITITAGGQPNQIIVTGINAGGSGTTVNGVTNGPVVLNNVTKGMKVSMLGGNDSVTTTNIEINGKVKILAGAGVDTIQLIGSTYNSDVKVRLSQGADTFFMNNTEVAGRFNVAGGTNFDDVAFNNSTVGELNVHLNEGNDTLRVASTQVITQTTLDGGEGINTFDEAGSNFFGGVYFKKKLAG